MLLYRRAESLPGYYLQLLLRPGTGISRVLADRVPVRRIAMFLAGVGFLRGIVEGVWLYAMEGQLPELRASLGQWEWYAYNGLPFVLCNIPSVHFLWLSIAVLLFAGGRLAGGRGDFPGILRVTGVYMTSYVVIALINYLYLVMPLPAIHFRAADWYSPQIGIGSIVMLSWLVYLSYVLVRRHHGLERRPAILVALLPFPGTLVLYVLSAFVFFRGAEVLTDLNRREAFILANYVYTLTTAAAVPVLVAAGYWLQRKWEAVSR